VDVELVNRIGVPGVLFYMVLRDALPRIMAKLKKDGTSPKMQGFDKDLALLEQRTDEIAGRVEEHHRQLIQNMTEHAADDVRRFDAINKLLIAESDSRREEIQDVRDIQVRQLERLGRIDAHLEHILVSKPRREQQS